MEKKEKLRDGTEVTIKEMGVEDIGGSIRFFQALPEEDRRYLRVDVSDPDVVEHRIRSADPSKVIRKVVLKGDEIIGDGTLELQDLGWADDVGEMRLIVAARYQRKGVGTLLARELSLLGMEKKLEKIVARVMRPQQGARKILHKLGFYEEAVLPDYFKDLTGQRQDMIILVCDVKEMWRELEHHFFDSDWGRHR